MDMKYILDLKDGEIESYEMELIEDEIDNHKIEMIFDKDSHYWTNQVRGKVCAKLKDHGNGVNIKLSTSDKKPKKISLDYSQIMELYLLLEYYFQDSGVPNQHLDPPELRKYIKT